MALLLMVLDPMLYNSYNLKVLIEINGIDEVANVMLQQKMPSEVIDFEYELPHVRPWFVHTIGCLNMIMQSENGVLTFLRSND